MAHCPCSPNLGLVTTIRFTWDRIYKAEPWSLRWAIKVASVITSESLAKGSHLNWRIIWGREGKTAIQLPIPKKRSPNLKGPGFGRWRLDYKSRELTSECWGFWSIWYDYCWVKYQKTIYSATLYCLQRNDAQTYWLVFKSLPIIFQPILTAILEFFPTGIFSN